MVLTMKNPNLVLELPPYPTDDTVVVDHAASFDIDNADYFYVDNACDITFNHADSSVYVDITASRICDSDRVAYC